MLCVNKAISSLQKNLKMILNVVAVGSKVEFGLFKMAAGVNDFLVFVT